MSNQNSKEYYAARGAKARELAVSAANPKIAAIHLEMAERYDLLADDAKSHSSDRQSVSK